MKKSDLARELRKKARLDTLKASEALVNLMLESIEDAIARGEDVTLRGLGTFSRNKDKGVQFVLSQKLKTRLT